MLILHLISVVVTTAVVVAVAVVVVELSIYCSIIQRSVEDIKRIPMNEVICWNTIKVAFLFCYQ